MYEKNIEKVRRMMYGEKKSAVPIFLDLDANYVCEYANENILKATWDYQKMIDAYDRFLGDIEHDVNTAPYWISPLKSEILGSRTWIQNHQNGVMQHPEICTLYGDEYRLLIDNPMKCFLSQVLPRMYKALEKDGAEAAHALVRAYMFDRTQGEDFYIKVYETSSKHSSPIYYGTAFCAPFDLLADYLRGITQIFSDLRRRKDQVKMACEVLSDVMIRYVEHTLPVSEPALPMVCCFVHLPPMINVKQFEQFFWPSFKKVCEALVDKGYHLYLQFQGDYRDGRYIEYCQQLPKDKIVMAFEKQNFEQTVNTLGENHMVSCSYPLEYLKSYPLEKCIEEARKLLDTGYRSGNRFYFGLSKPPLTKNDAAPEKLRGLFSFVRQYTSEKERG